MEDTVDSESKNYFDERNLTLVESVDVSVPYPYPYGFIPDTVTQDGDAVDCFIITARKLQVGQTVRCCVVGLMEYTEIYDIGARWRSVDDHKVLVVPVGEKISLNDEIKNKLRSFAAALNEQSEDKEISVGEFRDALAAKEYILGGRQMFVEAF